MRGSELWIPGNCTLEQFSGHLRVWNATPIDQRAPPQVPIVRVRICVLAPHVSAQRQPELVDDRP